MIFIWPPLRGDIDEVCDCEWCLIERLNPLWFVYEIIGEA